MTIGEYAAKFESLAKYFRFFQEQVDEDWLCERFEGGLRHNIKESVLPLEIRQFQPLVEKCRKIEAMKEGGISRGNAGGPSRSKYPTSGWSQKGKQLFKKPYSRPLGNDQNRRPYRPVASAIGNGLDRNQNQETTRRCFKCGKQDHLANTCPVKGMVCFKCGKIGHMARECMDAKAEPVMSNVRAAKQKEKGRVYTISGVEASQSENLIQGR